MVRAALTSVFGLVCLHSALAEPSASGASPGTAADTEQSLPAPGVPAEGEAPSPEYGATAQVEGQTEAAVALPEEAPRKVPGALGDPYRVFESMPGVTPSVSGLPYVYVRGSPPSGNAYYYDGIPLPQLFHLGVGPSIMHPLMLGKMSFHPGVSSARNGRRLGAVIAADAPDRAQRVRGEAELRLLDANAAVVAPIGDGDLTVAGRFGYPGLLTPVLGLDVTFSYWDYQLRATVPLDDDDRVQVVAFGSRDTLSDAQAVGAGVGYTDDPQGRGEQPLELEFHRLEARLVRRQKSFELGTAFRVGADHSELGDDIAARNVTMAPRIWYARRFAGGHIVRAGADMVASSGRVLRVLLPESFSEDALAAVARNALGAYVDTTLRVGTWSSLMLGLRTDAWILGDTVSPSLDPRVRYTVYPTDSLDVHAGLGLVHQPVVLPVPVPGFTDIAIDSNLQEGIQAEVGAGYDLFGELRFEAALFAHRYSDLLLSEVYLRVLGDRAQRSDALSYGLEVFLVRAPEHDLSGWISYTLGFARATDRATGRSFSPEFDIRHVLNLVLDAQLGAGFSAGLAARIRSGKPINQFTDAGVPPAYDIRLAPFVRLDGRFAYSFGAPFGRMEVYLEWLNLTLAREAIEVECYFGSCVPVEAQPIWFPNAGVRASF
ncbi:MAG: TonB-dependent receptor [Myxococcales bacterium]|nr:TonB-dependent receptor [Myxococcales bacterium]